MKSLQGVDIVICSILVIASVGFTKADLEQIKNRRGGTSGLFALPRVGRSDPSLNGNGIPNAYAADGTASDVLYPSSFEEYEEYPKSDEKRAGMLVLPRIGRSDADLRNWARFFALQQAFDKRAGPSATTGVWFGPRLGKRSIGNKLFENSLKPNKEY